MHDSEARPPWRNSLPVSGPRSEAGAYAKSRASVSERKHIKDGALLKEEGGKKGNEEQTALFPCLGFWFRVLCVHTLQ